jgi:hypothetical protein
MKIQDLIENRSISGHDIDVGLYYQRNTPFVALYIDGLEMIFQADLDANVDSYDDSFGWEQGETRGNETWTQHDLKGIGISINKLEDDPTNLADDLGEIFSVSPSALDSEDKIFKMLYRLFGGREKFESFIANAIMNDERSKEEVVDHYRNMQDDY